MEPRYGMRWEEAWIPMPDGVRLAATLYMPDDAQAGERFAPILEYLPYRKDDGLLERDHQLYRYLVTRGFVGARVDLRGTGRSEGRLPEGEYTEQEHRDGEAVIEWLAAQPWSNGSVGMWGISWGGFNAIQLGMRGPPLLKAIVAVDASDDLFHDDIHYIDGLMHLDEYELMIDQWNAMTRAPDFPTDEESLRNRFDAEPWLISWLRNQRDGPFWRRGSLRPHYDRLRVPAFLMAGWYDGYRDSVARMLEHVPASTRAIVGPWNHTWPHSAEPGPAIEWRADAVRWWDHWLRGRDTGLLAEPRVAVFVRGWHPPDVSLKEIPGRWRAEEDWPPPGLTPTALHLGPQRSLRPGPGEPETDHLPYEPTIGAEAGAWWGELTGDQAPLDERCLSYDSDPLEADVTILGLPEAVLHASVDASVAHFLVRLCDVAPDGRSTLVTGGGRGGTHRRSAAHPEPLEQGKVKVLPVPLRFTSWTFPAGHRIRVSVSNALWPMIWPTPHPMTLTLHHGGDHPSHVVLPVVPPSDRPEPRWPDPEPTEAPPGVGSEGEILPVGWDVRREGTRATAEYEGRSASWFPWGREDFLERLTFEADDADPATASARGDAETVITLGGRTLVWRSQLELRSDATSVHYRYRRELHEDGRPIRERRWQETFPRDHQ
jgi:putative CocE/NonD family hydrolase